MRRWSSVARSLLAGAILVACVVSLWDRFWVAVPFQLSFVVRLVGAAGAVALFTAAALAAGLRLCGWLLPGPRRDGQTAVAFASGVLLFGVAVAIAGHLGLLSTPLFFVLPVLLLLGGLGPLIEWARGVPRRLQVPFVLSPWRLALILVGAAGLLLAVLPALDPANVNYDARWYHLGIAEQYVVAGAITPSLEGDNHFAGPHLVSWLYTWAFLEVRAQLFDRVLLANLLEVVCFLFTLGLIPVAARVLRPPDVERPLSEAWVAFFLFPAIFIYDTGLMAGADRFAAFWAISAFVAWGWARRSAGWRPWAFLGLLLAGTFLCKFTSVIFLAPAVVAIAANALWRRAWRGPVVAAAAAFVSTTPYWLENLAFYGNPVYPLAHRWLGGHPWTVHSSAWLLRYSKELFVPDDGSPLFRVKQTLLALANHHVDSYTWPDFVAGAPVFGSVFACLVLVLPLTRKAGRLWGLTAVCATGIAIWFNLAHQMRYLTIFVPLMAAAVAVLSTVVWSWGWAARLGLTALVALQIFGSAEVPFFGTHRMNGRRAPLAHLLDFLQRGQTERSLARFRPFADWEDLGEKLPPKARLLVHSWGPTLGVNRAVMTDVPGIELGLSYAELGSLPAIHARLKALGVTHLAWRNDSDQPDSPLGELLFRAFTRLGVQQPFTHNDWTVAELADQAPAALNGEVMVLGCAELYPPGLYRKEALSTPVLPMNTPGEATVPEAPPSAEALGKADAAIVMGTCKNELDMSAFQAVGVNSGSTYWLRRKPLPAIPH